MYQNESWECIGRNVFIKNKFDRKNPQNPPKNKNKTKQDNKKNQKQKQKQKQNKTKHPPEKKNILKKKKIVFLPHFK